MASALEIAGIALYAPEPTEIMDCLWSHLDTTDPYVFGEVAHAIGHIARRFGWLDANLFAAVTSAADRFAGFSHVSGALYDMRCDIQHFAPEIRDGELVRTEAGIPASCPVGGRNEKRQD